MNVIADLHIHGRYSRGCSTSLDVTHLEKYARIKGLNLLGTGDFTHPKWLKEIENNLTEDDKGVLRTENGFPFLLQTEISLIYTQDSKGRRIHNVVLAPSLAVVKQITEALKKKGRVDYDGRPIFNISCPEFVEMMRQVSEDVEIIPAHCLLPDGLIHTKEGVKKISQLEEGDFTLTHLGKFKKIKKIYRRAYQGKVIRVIPSCLKKNCYMTPEHPIYAIKSYKSCKNVPHTICKPTCAYIKRGCKLKKFKEYKPNWVPVKDIKKGDIIVYPRYTKVKDKSILSLSKLFPKFYLKDAYLMSRKSPAGVKNTPIKNKIKTSKEFCRLVGYFLAEGYILKDRISFTFNRYEKNYIKDVKNLLLKVFGKYIRFYEEKEKSNGVSFSVYSKILSKFFRQFYSLSPYKAFNKKIPSWIMDLPPEKQKQLFVGWWRGDVGYTSSKLLANQIKVILLRLGIIPSISTISYKDILLRRLRKPCFIGKRRISATKDCYQLNNLSFFSENKDLLKYPEFKKYKTILKRRKGWIDNSFIYLPIIKIEKKIYKGEVFNLEVADDNSYTTESLAVHNCWTPWFSLFGSNSGFDSVKEAFQDKTKHIHALETGLSSDPLMNWRLSQLDKYNLVSFSDSHSYWPWRIGREATTFDIKELTYKNILKAIRTGKELTGTIEVDPHFGKYHMTGHRACNVCLKPKEALKIGNICPKCKRKLTVGVLQRIEELADRPEGFRPKNAKDFKVLIPLSEVLARVLEKGIATQATWKEYNNLVNAFDPEFKVLLDIPSDELKKVAGEDVAKAILKNRENKILVKPGYDGVYGEPSFNGEQKKKQKSLTDF